MVGLGFRVAVEVARTCSCYKAAHEMQARCGQLPCCCEVSTSGRAPSATTLLAQWRQPTTHVQRSLYRVGRQSSLLVAAASVQHKHKHDAPGTSTLSASDGRGFEPGLATDAEAADDRLAGLHAADYEVNSRDIPRDPNLG